MQMPSVASASAAYFRCIGVASHETLHPLRDDSRISYRIFNLDKFSEIPHSHMAIPNGQDRTHQLHL